MDFIERFAESDDDDGRDVQSFEENFKGIAEDEDFKTTAKVSTTTEALPSTTETPKRMRKPKTKRDLSAGQFYSGLVETLSLLVD